MKATKKPRTTWLCIWAFWRLWWVDRYLQPLAIAALKAPISVPQLLNQDLCKRIERRVTVIAWVANYHPCRPQCLHRSLVLYLWLRNQGIFAQLEVGWGDKIGHAWVSYADKVLNDCPNITTLTPSLQKMYSSNGSTSSCPS